MVKQINEAWGWKGFTAKSVIQTNEFGNIIFKSSDNKVWRIIPEELSCEIIADNVKTFQHLSKESAFELDWEMKRFVEIAKEHVGKLTVKKRYYLFKPAVLGGKYDAENIGLIDFDELISLSGDYAQQIDGLLDGTEVSLV